MTSFFDPSGPGKLMFYYQVPSQHIFWPFILASAGIQKYNKLVCPDCYQVPEVETADGEFVQQGDEPHLILTTGEVRRTTAIFS